MINGRLSAEVQGFRQRSGRDTPGGSFSPSAASRRYDEGRRIYRPDERRYRHQGRQHVCQQRGDDGGKLGGKIGNWTSNNS